MVPSYVSRTNDRAGRWTDFWDLSVAALRIATVFILGIVLVSGRALIIGILAIIEKLRPDHAKLASPPPGVTVLIPAYNEESVIVQTVNSVLLSDLEGIHVIVVDDGSADSTLELLQSNFGNNEAVQIIHQVNRGKAAALNNALSQLGHRHRGYHRCRYRNRARRDSQIAAPFLRPDRGGSCGQCESWQSFALADPLASARVCHQPEHGKTRVRSAELHYGRAWCVGRLAQKSDRGSWWNYRGYSG